MFKKWYVIGYQSGLPAFQLRTNFNEIVSNFSPQYGMSLNIILTICYHHIGPMIGAGPLNLCRNAKSRKCLWEMKQ